MAKWVYNHSILTMGSENKIAKLLRKKLNDEDQRIMIFAMGGGISGRVHKDGTCVGKKIWVKDNQTHIQGSSSKFHRNESRRVGARHAPRWCIHQTGAPRREMEV